MSSERRIAASRANGAKSRGPVTPEGKKNSEGHNLRHGILADTLVLDSESPVRFDALLEGLIGELRPETGIERAFVDSMAIARWRQMRIWALEKSGLDHEIRKQESVTPAEDTATRATLAFRALCDRSNSLELMNRYEIRFDRQYSRALRQFYEARRRRARNLKKSDFAV